MSHNLQKRIWLSVEKTSSFSETYIFKRAELDAGTLGILIKCIKFIELEKINKTLTRVGRLTRYTRTTVLI